MRLIKAMKYGFVTLIALLVIKIISQELFDSRPFRFETYRNGKQLDEAAKARFLLGSNVDKIISDLQKSGAICSINKLHRETKLQVTCEYNSSLISLHPLEWYVIWIDADKEHRLIELSTHRVSGLTLVIP